MFVRRLFLFTLFAALLIVPAYAKQGSGSSSGSGSDAGSGSGTGSGTGSAGSGTGSAGSGTGSASPGGTGVALKWRFEKGKPLYQTMTTTTDQVLKLTGNEIKQSQNQTFIYSWTLDGDFKPDGDNVFKQKIEGLKMEINIGGNKVEYDSSKDAGGANPLSDFFKNLVGQEFTVTVDKDFKIKDIKGKDALIKKLASQNKPMEDLLNQILNDDAMKEMAEPTFSSIPNKTVEKGAKWERKSKLDMGPIGTYANDYTYEFKGEDQNKKQQVDVEVKVNYTKPDEKKTGLPFKIKDAKINPTTGKGQVLFSTETGWVERVTTTLNITGELTIDIGGQTTKVELDQKQTTTVTTSKDNPTSKGSK